MLINADIGEMSGSDEKILPHLDIANIACGYHASNPAHMEKTVWLTAKHEVPISAHPGYKDPENFGRVSIPHTQKEIVELVQCQVQLLHEICIDHGTSVQAIKPHGALYHDMMRDTKVREAVIYVAKKYQVPLIVQASPIRQQHAQPINWGTKVLYEVFADRAYRPDGELLPRSESGALHKESDKIIDQAKLFIAGNFLEAISSSKLDFKTDTICFHGDNPASVEALQNLNAPV